MIKYLGSKRTLITQLTDVVDSIDGTKTVLDLFSGTSRVGYALKQRGYRVFANDHNSYAHTIAQCYVAADSGDVLSDAEKLVQELNGLTGEAGYFTKTFCEESWFFKPKNGRRVDAIRNEIERKCLPPELKAVMLVSLMEAADRVDSTCGVQMAYLKKWARRAENDLQLRVPAVLSRVAHGKCVATCKDAVDAAATEVDVAYIDPPYNQHSYLSNYHIWETLVRWDNPEAYGKARKRTDCRERRSDFNSKPRCREALSNVLKALRARTIVLSFSNEGYVSCTELQAMLGELGDVTTVAVPHKRYVGAQIGIYNPSGDKVGKVSHLSNVEFIHVVRNVGYGSSSAISSSDSVTTQEVSSEAAPTTMGPGKHRSRSPRA